MQREKFRKWLEDNGIKERTAETYVNTVATIARYEKKIDEKYKKDKCKELLLSYEYTKDDRNSQRLPKHKIPISSNNKDLYQSYYQNTLIYKSNLNRYIQFLDETSKTTNETIKSASEQIPNESETELFVPKQKKYWMYAPGEQANLWDEFYNSEIMGIGWDDLGNLKIYKSRDEIREQMQSEYGGNQSYMNNSLTVWQFANDIQIGDVVYVKQGINTILGRGIVKSEYLFDDNRDRFKNTRKIEWTHIGEFESPEKNAQKTLTEISQQIGRINSLELLFSEGQEIIEDDEVKYNPYLKDDFLSDVFMTGNDYDTIRSLLLRKKNIILQGAPGVGKTFAAKRLAYSIMGEEDSSRVQLLQFHQSYSYEDFIMGYRPREAGFELTEGAFYKFCNKAKDDSERDYFFIIDEINRGNLSKIFGELFMLIEYDKRDEANQIRLLYKDELFYIPSNVHIIGMMNTADRSLAMLDYALRRRFAFFEIKPAFDSVGFKAYQKEINNTKFDKLIKEIIQLNNEIKNDASLGAGFRIGHSYFIECKDNIVNNNWINAIVEYEVLPLLQEYWFDESAKVEDWVERLRNAIK